MVLYSSLIIFLTAFQCEEEVIEPDALVENNDLVRIADDKTSFSVGEFIHISAEISNRQLTNNNLDLLLTDYMVQENKALYYSLGLFRIDAANKQIPVVISEVSTVDGRIEFSDQSAFFTVASPLNESNDTFRSDIGIKLEEAGAYILLPETARFPDNKHFIVFDLYGLAEQGSLQLNTSILNADEDGIYRFTVE